MEISKEDIIEIIKEEVDSSAFEPDELEGNLPLSDQGVDSLDKSSLLLGVEEKYDVEITDEEAQKLQSIDDIIKFLEAY